MTIEENFSSVAEMLTQLQDTRGVPRNVKAVIESAIKALHDKKDSPSARLSTVLTMLDEISNDPNIPAHLRTELWNLVSMLESMKNQIQ